MPTDHIPSISVAGWPASVTSFSPDEPSGVVVVVASGPDGVGPEIDEAPIMGHGQTGTLGDRVPITVEPGIYLPGPGGVRIEDTLVVRAGSGTAAPQDILITTTRD